MDARLLTLRFLHVVISVAAVPKPDTLLKIFDRLGLALSVMVRKKDGF